MNAREKAVSVLTQIEKDKSYVGLVLKNTLSDLEDARERNLATELIYGVIRYKKRLDYLRDCFSNVKASKLHPMVVQIIRVTLYQILYLEKIPVSAACNAGVEIAKKYVNAGAAKYVNGIVRTVLRNKDALPCPETEFEALGMETSFPKSILDIWVSDYGFEKACEIAKQSNIPKKTAYRINKLKAPSDFAMPETPAAPQNESLFKDGLLTVQDKGSRLAAETLSPKKGDKVLDLCAAPGGKSCYMAELMQNEGEIIACDVHEHRLKLIEETAKRLGANIIKPILNDGTVFRTEWEEKFDCVLTDVPCSGLGVISGKPDIKWRKQDYKTLCALQLEILKCAMCYVKKGGALVYSTCTVHKAENEDVVRAALAENPTFSYDGDPIQLFPSAEHDGFYVCRLKKEL
ncbi:MAG: 16S rRNA (cytosine(967)-C(5))-methyltransferase RsmB [Clostridia bacterium]|nr:16S rRNA (cytosine(967)-C(5))-methyltransferase RsmB [Clostridia bacterium]